MNNKQSSIDGENKLKADHTKQWQWMAYSETMEGDALCAKNL